MGRRKGFNYRGVEFNRDKNVCATYRLRTLLQLDNNPTLYRKFKQELYHVAEKHLDIQGTLRYQTDGWDAIEAELVSTFPDIFETKEPKTHLDLALQIISSYHYRRRFAFKQQQAPGEDLPKKPKLVMSVCVPTRASLRRQKRTEAMKREDGDIIDLTVEHDEDPKVEFVEPKLPQMMGTSNSQPGPVPVKVKIASGPGSLLWPISLPIAGPSTKRTPVVATRSQSTPPRVEGRFQAQSIASSSQRKPGNSFHLTGVARFLNACFPSMTHLLNHFIEFGCTNEEYLHAVSTWPTDRISCFLSQVSGRAGDGRRLSEMDMLVLQNHFISYFNKA